MALVARAWLEATCPNGKYRDGEKALKDSKKACELASWKNGNCLGVLAAAYAENGDFPNAVKWQQKVIDLVPEKHEKQTAILRFRLSLYKTKRPFHGSGESE